MKKIIVLGAGMVGSAMAIDLSNEFDVTVVDIDSKNLDRLNKKSKLKTLNKDLSDPKNIKEIVKEFDLVIGAVPGFMGFATTKSVIEAGKNIVDISFFNEDPFLLDEIAKQNNVTAIIDCGVAPGMSNIILGYYNKKMTIDYFEFMVGGLPFKRELPFQYKAPFSPIDVIEEYTRPARLVENGKQIVKPALSEPEFVTVDPIGTLEAFNTDGLRTLLKTMNIPNMKEKTLRYPGHIDLMRVLRDSGFFNEEKIDINGANISPIQLTSKLLFPQWKLKEDEDEFTVMKVVVEGKVNNKKKRITYNLFDRFDKTTGTSSMARTTGYTCTAAAKLVLNNDFAKVGIIPPEFLGEDEKCFKSIIDHLKIRNIKYLVDEELLS